MGEMIRLAVARGILSAIYIWASYGLVLMLVEIVGRASFAFGVVIVGAVAFQFIFPGGDNVRADMPNDQQ